VLGKISDVLDDGSLSVTTADGRTVTGKRFAARDELDEKEADLVQMAHVDTPNILHTLRHRHAEGSVYTAVGQMGAHTPRAT
jgi:myosin heavy subunit